MTPHSNNQDTDFLVKLVKRSAKFARQSFSTSEKDNHGDLVTSSDLGIEAYIIKHFKKRYPNFDIVSEEFNPEGILSDNCLIIDPIDGTINFAHGIPLWGIQVALQKDGEITCAVLYFPKLQEMFWADPSGAYKNGERITVSNTPFNKALYLVEGGPKFAALTEMEKCCSRHWRYYCCSALNHAWTACGRLGGMIYRKEHVWDYLPGQYLVKQAGGTVINEPKGHVVANTPEFAQMLIQHGKSQERPVGCELCMKK